MRLGLLWPADGRNDAEFWRWLPRNVELLIARYDVGGTLDLGQLQSDAEAEILKSAAGLLRHVQPDAVGLGDCAGSFIGGKGIDLDQAKAVSDVLGCPALTMSTALIVAANSLAMKNVAVLSPYSADVTDKLVEFLDQHGIGTASRLALDLGDEQTIDAMSATDWITHASNLTPRGDGLIVAGGGISLSNCIPQLETVLHSPVICGPGALMWALLQRLGVTAVIPNRGRLFANSPVDDPLAVIDRHLSRATKTYAVSDRPPIFSSANGSWVTTTEGRRLLDFACGSGTTSLGHNHPRITAAVQSVLECGLSHVGPHFLAEQQVALLNRLTEIMPEHLGRFQPATNGSEATEIALKAAMHFTGARKFLAFDGSYHGRGFGALAVSSRRARGGNAALAPFAPDAVFLPFGADATGISETLERDGPFAGIIVEPLQATQGMIVPPSDFLRSLREAARTSGTPLIFDEVFTGFARTGSMFYFEQAGVVPDLLILAKAFGGGFPAALVCGCEDIMTNWSPGTQSSTFQLHPLAAAASLAMIDTILGDDLCTAARMIGRHLQKQTGKLRRYDCVHDIRGLGAMFGVEIVDAKDAPDQTLTKRIRREALENGNLITWECGSAGHVIGLVPPLTVHETEIATAVDALDAAIQAIST